MLKMLRSYKDNWGGIFEMSGIFGRGFGQLEAKDQLGTKFIDPSAIGRQKRFRGGDNLLISATSRESTV